jgi:hypothetical protein
MARLIQRTAQNLILRVKLLTDAGSPLVDVEFDDEDLVVRYLRAADTAWQTVTLTEGEAATYESASWIGIGGGWHELSLPNAAIVAGTRTEIEIEYAENEPQADAIDAVLGLSDDEVEAIATELADKLRATAEQLFGGSQFTQAGEIRVRQRDDYSASDGRAFDINYTKAGVDFTSATVVAGAGSQPGVPQITPTVTLVNKTVGSVTIRLEFTTSQLNVAAGRYNWDAHIVLSSRRNTVVGGVIVVEPKYADAPPP